MKKEFDAVEMMREIRQKLQEEYERDPNLRTERLKEIHKKYNFPEPEKKDRNYTTNR